MGEREGVSERQAEGVIELFRCSASRLREPLLFSRHESERVREKRESERRERVRERESERERERERKRERERESERARLIELFRCSARRLREPLLFRVQGSGFRV